MTDEMFEHIALESNKYAHQKKGDPTNYCPRTLSFCWFVLPHGLSKDAISL